MWAMIMKPQNVQFIHPVSDENNQPRERTTYKQPRLGLAPLEERSAYCHRRRCYCRRHHAVEHEYFICKLFAHRLDISRRICSFLRAERARKRGSIIAGKSVNIDSRAASKYPEHVYSLIFHRVEWCHLYQQGMLHVAGRFRDAFSAIRSRDASGIEFIGLRTNGNV